MSRLRLALLLLLPVYAGTPGAPSASAQQPTIRERWETLEVRPAGDPGRLGDAAALLFDAGELGPALVLAERALVDRPSDLGLLWRAASIATSLSDAERARRYADRLWAAVQDQARDDDAWQEAALSLEKEAEQLQLAAEERASLLRRARAVSLVGLTAVGAALWLVLRGAARPS